MKKIYLLGIFLLFLLHTLHAQNSPIDDNKRYLAIMLLNDHEEATFSDIIQEGKNKGFNAVYLSVRWDAIKCHNSACMTGNSVNPSWNPSNRYWTQIDAEVAQARSLGMKIAFRIHLGSADVTNFGAPAQRSKYLWGDDNYMRQPNGSEDLGGYAFRQFSFSKQPAIDSAKLFVAEVLNRYNYLVAENNLLFYSVSIGGAQEMEYSGSYLLDYSTASTSEYTAWYLSKYGTNNPSVPQEFTSTEGKKWYTFRHKKMKDFIATISTQIKNFNFSNRFVNDYGSVFDAISAGRGTLGFKSLGAGTDGIKINDAEDYDHRFSMDIIRTNFPSKPIMNEMLTQQHIVSSNPTVYADFMNQSFAHGAKLFSVVTGTSQIQAMSSIYTQVVNTWITPTFSAVNANGTVNYTFDEILHASFNGNRFSTSSRNIYQEWVNAYNSNPSNTKPVNVYLNDDELNGNCPTPPAAPSLTASPPGIAQGGTSTLSASGCSGGTINWSDGLGTGVSKQVSPPATKTYTASCSLNGCTSSNASVTVTVNTGQTQCLESESMNGNGPITGDPNASNGSTRGAENNYNHYVDYAINVPSAGSYSVTLRYYSSAAPVIGVQVNGGSTQTVNLANTGSWNIVWAEQTFSVNLAASNNTIRIQGTGGGSCRQDRICVTGGVCSAPAAPSLSASPSSITSGGSSTLTASGCSGGTITWSDGLGTGTSKSVSPASTKTYTANCSIGGCTSSNGSVTVNVCTPPAAPTLTANPASIISGASSTLSATGCSGGTITWSNGLGTGTSKSVSPPITTTYTATCSIAGCMSGNGSVTVSVDGGTYNQCKEAELMNGNGPVTSDPNASNGSTRGAENNYNHYVDYVVTNVPSAGSYFVKLWYYSSAAPTVGVQVNGGSTQTVNLANSFSWNIAWTTQQFSVNLAAGTNTIRISGTGGGSCRQDKLCVSNTTQNPAVLGIDPAAINAENAGKMISVFPNPNKGIFETSFYLEKGKKATIIVSDMQGRTIYRQSVTGRGQNREKINLNNKASGTLLLQLHKENATEVKKINISR